MRHSQKAPSLPLSGPSAALLACLLAILSTVTSSPAAPFGLELVDWLNDGISVRCAADPARSLAFVEMRRSEEHDLAVFRYPTGGDGSIEHLATIKGFGSDIVRHGSIIATNNRNVVTLWDMTNPVQPKRLSSVRQRSWYVISLCCLFRANLLYVLCNGSAEIYDISDPTRPVLLETCTVGGGSSALLTDNLLITLGYAEGGYLLSLHDLHSSPPLAHLGELAVERATSSNYQPAPDAAILADAARLVFAEPGDTQLHVCDLGDPANPVLLSSIETGGQILQVATASDDTFLLRDTSGFSICRLDPDGTVWNENDPAIIWYARRGTVCNDFLFLTGDCDLRVCRILENSEFAEIGQANPDQHVYQMRVDGGTIYYTAGWSGYPCSPAYTRKVCRKTGHMGPATPLDLVATSLDAHGGKVALTGFGILTLLERNENGDHHVVHQSNVDFDPGRLDVHRDHLWVGEKLYQWTGGEPRLLRTEPGYAEAVMFGDYCARINDDKTVSIVRLPDFTPVMTIPCEAIRLRVSEDSLFVWESASLVIACKGVDGGLLWNRNTVEPWMRDGSFQVSADDSVAIVWAGPDALVYGYDSAGRVRILNRRVTIPSASCPGGRYGFLQDGFFYTMDTFSSLTVMRLDYGLNPLQLDRNANGLILTWPSVELRKYRLMQSADLRSWSPVGDEHLGTGQPMSVGPFPLEGNRCFFRVADVGE